MKKLIVYVLVFISSSLFAQKMTLVSISDKIPVAGHPALVGAFTNYPTKAISYFFDGMLSVTKIDSTRNTWLWYVRETGRHRWNVVAIDMQDSAHVSDYLFIYVVTDSLLRNSEIKYIDTLHRNGIQFLYLVQHDTLIKHDTLKARWDTVTYEYASATFPANAVVLPRGVIMRSISYSISTLKVSLTFLKPKVTW